MKNKTYYAVVIEGTGLAMRYIYLDKKAANACMTVFKIEYGDRVKVIEVNIIPKK